MKEPKRITQLEYRKRLDVMTALLARSIPYSHLVRIACQQWDVSERQAKRYIQKAREQEKNIGSQPLTNQYYQLIGRFIYIYQQAIQLRDLELARRSGQDMLKLLKQAKRDLSHEEFQSCESRLVGPNELEALVRALEKQGKNYPDE